MIALHSWYRMIALVLLASLLVNSCKRPTERLDGFGVHGIDVSHYQKEINWEEVMREQVHFAFVKATEGQTYRDSIYCHNWDEMQRVGIMRGAYHFYVPSVHPLEQANNYIGTVDLAGGDLPPVLDFEKTGGKTAAAIRSDLRVWLDEVEAFFGVKPIIYTNQQLYHRYLKGHFDGYPLWVARYNTIAPDMPRHQPWTFWQYGNRGRIAGISGPVDFNVFNGRVGDLWELGYEPKEDRSSSSITYSTLGYAL